METQLFLLFVLLVISQGEELISPFPGKRYTGLLRLENAQPLF